MHNKCFKCGGDLKTIGLDLISENKARKKLRCDRCGKLVFIEINYNADI